MKQTRFDRNFDIIVCALLLLLLLIVAFPLYFVIIASFSNPADVVMGRVIFFPSGFTLAGYREIIRYSRIWTGYRNTLIYVVSHTLISVPVTMLAGYALTRKTLPFRKGITIFFTVTMFFNGGLVPTYLWVQQMGLVGSPLAVILMGTVSAYNILVARSFISSNIAEEMYEAALLDGCNHTKFFWHIVLRLSPALLSVLTLFAAVGMWNSWFNALIYLRDSNLMPLQMVLRSLILSATMSTEASQGADMAEQAMLGESMKYAVIIVSSLPIMCLYPFIQKYFVKGIMVGAVKG